MTGYEASARRPLLLWASHVVAYLMAVLAAFLFIHVTAFAWGRVFTATAAVCVGKGWVGQRTNYYGGNEHANGFHTFPLCFSLSLHQGDLCAWCLITKPHQIKL